MRAPQNEISGGDLLLFFSIMFLVAMVISVGYTLRTKKELKAAEFRAQTFIRQRDIVRCPLGAESGMAHRARNVALREMEESMLRVAEKPIRLKTNTFSDRAERLRILKQDLIQLGVFAEDHK